MITRAWLVIAAVLFATACSDDSDARPDGSLPVADGSALTEEDAGPIACTAEMANAASTVGCNGGFQGEAGENQPGGHCEVGDDENPPGSCATEGAICMGSLAGPGPGWCVVSCAPPEALVDMSTCPTGYRCFRQGEGEEAFGLCFRDCDADHPCQEGWTCNASLGRCEETPAS